MDSERVNVSLPRELFARMEAERGDVSRSKFVQRALESVLGETGSAESTAAAGTSAPSRASAKPRGKKSTVTAIPALKSTPEDYGLPKIAPRRWAK